MNGTTRLSLSATPGRPYGSFSRIDGAIGGPYRVVVGEIRVDGAAAGQLRLDGQTAGEMRVDGAIIGELDGRHG